MIKKYEINTAHIRAVKRKKKISIKAIAKELEVQDSQIYKIIRGERTLDIIKGKILADMLDIPMEELLKEK